MKARLGSSYGTSWGAYPERLEPTPSWFDRMGKYALSPFMRIARTHSQRRRPFVKSVASHSKWANGLSQARLREEAAEVGSQLREHGFTSSLVAKAFSLVREASDRTTNKRHFDVQLIGAE